MKKEESAHMIEAKNILNDSVQDLKAENKEPTRKISMFTRFDLSPSEQSEQLNSRLE